MHKTVLYRTVSHIHTFDKSKILQQFKIPNTVYVAILRLPPAVLLYTIMCQQLKTFGFTMKITSAGRWIKTLRYTSNLLPRPPVYKDQGLYRPHFSGPSGTLSMLLNLYMFLRYRPIFKIAIFEHETWQVAKVPEVVHTLSFYPRGSKLSLSSLYWEQFPRYGPIFKTANFGHEKFQKLHILSLHYPPPPESQISLRLSYGWPRNWQFFIFPLAKKSQNSYSPKITFCEDCHRQVLESLVRKQQQPGDSINPIL